MHWLMEGGSSRTDETDKISSAGIDNECNVRLTCLFLCCFACLLLRGASLISSMLYTGTEVPNRGGTGNGKAANGWEDGGMGGRSRWGNCSL